jgi:hypothetical protein
MDADRGGDEEGDYDSCYSTPIGSEAMLSPNQDYGGDTLDLRHVSDVAAGRRLQHQVLQWQGAAVTARTASTLLHSVSSAVLLYLT